MQKYDYLIVGAGLFGSVFAYKATQKGKRCAVIDKREHIGGNCYTYDKYGITIHKYGPHIFHTSNKQVWDFINQFGEFNNFINQPIAFVNGKMYNLPFNMNMFSRIFGAVKPDDVLSIIKKETASYVNLEPSNLEEQSIKSVGTTIYNNFIKGYTEKQWGKKCSELPASTIKRLPLRFTYDNNYFNDTYQGIPKKGYTSLFENMLKGIDVELCHEYNKDEILAEKTIYTGPIDEYFDYIYGPLEYRSLAFVDTEHKTENFQGNAIVNYPDYNVQYTRSIEHRHFNKETKSDKTIVSYEFSLTHKQGQIPYYPIGNEKNLELYKDYLALATKNPSVIFKGRLGSYKYYDMDDTIEDALGFSEYIL